MALNEIMAEPGRGHHVRAADITEEVNHSTPARYPSPTGMTCAKTWDDAMLYALAYAKNSRGALKCTVHGHPLPVGTQWVVTLYDRAEYAAFKATGQTVVGIGESL